MSVEITFLFQEAGIIVCVSDGMGSGPSAFRESDMVVELMQKFMEAGFPQGDSYPHDEFGNGSAGRL